jgi:hypothetical protein
LIAKEEESASFGPILNCLLKVVMKHLRVLIGCCNIQEILYTNYASIKENFKDDKEYYDIYLRALANLDSVECRNIRNKFAGILGQKCYLE